MRASAPLALSTALAAAVPAFASDPVSTGTAGDILVFGGQVALVGMLAVFLGLIAIFAAVKVLGRIASGRPARHSSSAAKAGATAPPEVTADVAHAIAMALYLDLRTFGESPPGTVTIRKVTRPYSAWWNSGKTQMMIDKRTFPPGKG